ncbi:MAG: hypothetical protein ABJD97_01800 [Betaproteobacteria bacterium]
MSRWSAEPRVFHLDAAAGGAGTPAWAAAVAALAHELDAAPLARRSRVGCVVPGRHVRYLLVPWNAVMQARAARQAFAEHCFRETYGELARDWVVRAGAGACASATRACAIDAALLDELGRVFALRGLVLCSVTPSLVHELAVLGDGLPAGASWVVVPEADALTVLLLEDGRPQRVAVAHGGPAQLPQLLAREWFALGRDDRWAHVELRPERAATRATLAEAA